MILLQRGSDLGRPFSDRLDLICKMKHRSFHVSGELNFLEFEALTVLGGKKDAENLSSYGPG